MMFVPADRAIEYRSRAWISHRLDRKITEGALDTLYLLYVVAAGTR
jgi:hypothetical protein